MAKNQFAAAHFHDEEPPPGSGLKPPAGRTVRYAPNAGSTKHYATKKLGLYRCGASTCRKDFTVMTGTVMERSHAKLIQWAVAFHMAASSKKGFSAHQLHRELGCQYNTAWFLHHRVMEAMRRGGLDLPPMGGEGKVVEADETYYRQYTRGEAPAANDARQAVLQKPVLCHRSQARHHRSCRARRRGSLIQRAERACRYGC